MVNNLMKASVVSIVYFFFDIYIHLSYAIVLRFNDAQHFVLPKTVENKLEKFIKSIGDGKFS